MNGYILMMSTELEREFALAVSLDFITLDDLRDALEKWYDGLSDHAYKMFRWGKPAGVPLEFLEEELALFPSWHGKVKFYIVQVRGLHGIHSVD